MSVFVQAIIFVVASLMAIQSVLYLREPIITSPGILPLVVSVAAALLAGALLVGDFLSGAVSLRRIRRMFVGPSIRDRAMRTTGWLVLASGYAVATPVVGFMLATLVFLLIALVVFARLVWWQAAIAAIAIATIVPLVFRYVFFAIVP